MRPTRSRERFHDVFSESTLGVVQRKKRCNDCFSVILAAIALVYWAYFGEPARAQSRTAQQQLAVDIYKELVEINTVTATGDTARAAEAMAARLRTAGFSETWPRDRRSSCCR